MKNREYGLVAAGGVSQSFLARLPGFLADLGPIKAPSYRAARRISNSLRRGHAASHYSVMESCAMIWISVPEASLDRVASELVTQAPIQRTMVVIVGVTRDSLMPSPLLTAGARLATLNAVDGTGERGFVAEGHPDTLRQLRRMFIGDKKKLIELAPASKAFYFAGLQFATSFLLPSISTASESFTRAGFRQKDALAIAGSLGVQALYLYEKAGRKAWNPKVARELRHALEKEVEPLRAIDKKLADAYADGIRRTLHHFERPRVVAAKAGD